MSSRYDARGVVFPIGTSSTAVPLHQDEYRLSGSQSFRGPQGPSLGLADPQDPVTADLGSAYRGSKGAKSLLERETMTFLNNQEQIMVNDQPTYIKDVHHLLGRDREFTQAVMDGNYMKILIRKFPQGFDNDFFKKIVIFRLFNNFWNLRPISTKYVTYGTEGWQPLPDRVPAAVKSMFSGEIRTVPKQVSMGYIEGQKAGTTPGYIRQRDYYMEQVMSDLQVHLYHEAISTLVLMAQDIIRTNILGPMQSTNYPLNPIDSPIQFHDFLTRSNASFAIMQKNRDKGLNFMIKDLAEQIRNKSGFDLDAVILHRDVLIDSSNPKFGSTAQGDAQSQVILGPSKNPILVYRSPDVPAYTTNEMIDPLGGVAEWASYFPVIPSEVTDYADPSWSNSKPVVRYITFSNDTVWKTMSIRSVIKESGILNNDPVGTDLRNSLGSATVQNSKRLITLGEYYDKYSNKRGEDCSSVIANSLASHLPGYTFDMLRKFMNLTTIANVKVVHEADSKNIFVMDPKVYSSYGSDAIHEKTPALLFQLADNVYFLEEYNPATLKNPDGNFKPEACFHSLKTGPWYIRVLQDGSYASEKVQNLTNVPKQGSTPESLFMFSLMYPVFITSLTPANLPPIQPDRGTGKLPGRELADLLIPFLFQRTPSDTIRKDTDNWKSIVPTFRAWLFQIPYATEHQRFRVIECFLELDVPPPVSFVVVRHMIADTSSGLGVVCGKAAELWAGGFFMSKGSSVSTQEFNAMFNVTYACAPLDPRAVELYPYAYLRQIRAGGNDTLWDFSDQHAVERFKSGNRTGRAAWVIAVPFNSVPSETTYFDVSGRIHGIHAAGNEAIHRWYVTHDFYRSHLGVQSKPHAWPGQRMRPIGQTDVMSMQLSTVACQAVHQRFSSRLTAWEHVNGADVLGPDFNIGGYTKFLHPFKHSGRDSLT